MKTTPELDRIEQRCAELYAELSVLDVQRVALMRALELADPATVDADRNGGSVYAAASAEPPLLRLIAGGRQGESPVAGAAGTEEANAERTRIRERLRLLRPRTSSTTHRALSAASRGTSAGARARLSGTSRHSAPSAV